MFFLITPHLFINISANAEDKAIPSESRQVATLSPDLKCKYGDHELQIGDKVSDDNKCVECECQIPPMVTCVQKRDC